MEAAIVLPVFLLLVGGVLEFGFFFYQQQLVASGIRDGARYLALTDNPRNEGNQSRAINVAVYGDPTGGATPRVEGWAPDNVAVAITSVGDDEAFHSGTTIPVVTVSTNFTDPYLTPLSFLRLIGMKMPAINISHQERWVGGSY